MKKTAAFLGTLSLIFGLITPAAASLVGDAVLVQYIEADDVLPQWSSDGYFQVTEDDSDILITAWGNASLDMGPSGVEIALD